MSVYRKALALLTRREKSRGALVLLMVVIMAALETAGIASVMPFLTVLGDRDMIQTNPILSQAFDGLGFRSPDAFLFTLGATSFVLILFSTLFRALTHYAMNRFIEMRRHSLGERLLETYLRQPYAFFLNRHSNDMAKSILSEVDMLVIHVFRPSMMMVAYAVVTVSIIGLLIFIDPIISAAATFLIGGVYALVFLFFRDLLISKGEDRAQANTERFVVAGEALSGIKDIKLLGAEHAYLTRFRGPSIRNSRHQASAQTISQIPKFLMEAIGFGGVILLTLVLIMKGEGDSGASLGDVLPILGAYTFAGYRLLPAVQNVYQGIAKLRFGTAAVDSVYNDFRQRSKSIELKREAPQPLLPQKSIALEGVSFIYDNAPSPALFNINLAIPVGSFIGLVGGTGAGKTTLVDIFLGLLWPTEGEITVDGVPVAESNLRAWQGALGYVPQDIFLTDSSVSENIALGVPASKIDHEQVIRCARMAQIHDFILGEMPQKYATIVGERGVRLSGGQRQRIGIARALYHDPAILVFDEATSALDNWTEKAVMKSIGALGKSKTVIVIAHRLTTIKNCDVVVHLKQGRIIEKGTYEDLASQSESFRLLAADLVEEEPW